MGDKLKKLGAWKAYYIEVMLLLTLIGALVDDQVQRTATIVSIAYVVYRGLFEISNDLSQRNSTCRFLPILAIILIILVFILAFAVWITGMFGIFAIFHAITKG